MLQEDFPAAKSGRTFEQPAAKASPVDPRLRAATSDAQFRNPILPSPSADPWVMRHGEFYYSCESRNPDTIWVRKARNFTDLSESDGVMVWSAPAFGPDSKSLWAPELHRINDRWYIYYAADDGMNENHRMWVLEGLTDDPCGPYQLRGSLETSGWAIDGTILQLSDGGLYLLWSGWPGKQNGRQNLYIAPMRNPWTVSGPRILIAEPQESWECVDMPICEGPQVLQRNGRTFIVYSASGSWSEDYCLGLLELTGIDPLLAVNWTKRGCVFSKTDDVWGLGHCSFIKSPDNTEDWIVYHAKTKRKHGWNDRNVRAQKFGWTRDGLPDFGAPIAAGMPLELPSGIEKADVGI